MENELFKCGYLTCVIAAETEGRVLLELPRSLTDAGLISICAAGFLYEVDPERAQALIGPARFTDLETPRFNNHEEAAVMIIKRLEENGIMPLRR